MQIAFAGQQNIDELRIIDMNGKLIESININTESTDYIVVLNEYSSGMYQFVFLENSQVIETKPLEVLK